MPYVKTRASTGLVLLVCGHASAGIVPSMLAGATPLGFESSPLDAPPPLLSFPDGTTASITAIQVLESVVLESTDGHGAVPSEGSRFWKLRGGTTTLAFSTPISEFGFWYSDLEHATLRLSFGPGGQVELTDHNPGSPTFFGFRSDAGPFSTVGIEWLNANGDGIGLDGVYAVPMPAPPVLAALGLAALSIRRRGR